MYSCCRLIKGFTVEDKALCSPHTSAVLTVLILSTVFAYDCNESSVLYHLLHIIWSAYDAAELCLWWKLGMSDISSVEVCEQVVNDMTFLRICQFLELFVDQIRVEIFFISTDTKSKFSY